MTRKYRVAGLEHLWSTNRPLTLLILFTLASMLVSFTGLIFDHRQISGELAWIKPLKFSVSLSLYAASLMWLSNFITGNRRLLRWSFVGAFAGSVIELVGIMVQVARGTTSHFNTATPLDGIVFVVIELAIIPVALAIMIMFVLLLREKNLPAVMGLAMRVGVFLTLVGIIPGVLMLLPNSLQNIIVGNRMFVGHTVGYATANARIPFLGWSTVAGDLRIAHFVGLHALQVLPIIGFVVSRFCTGISLNRQKALIAVTGAAYFGWLVLLTWQALKAESIVSPSNASLAIGAAIVFLSLSSIVCIMQFPYLRVFCLAEVSDDSNKAI